MHKVSKYKLQCISVKEKSKITAWTIGLPCYRKTWCNREKNKKSWEIIRSNRAAQSPKQGGTHGACIHAYSRVKDCSCLDELKTRRIQWLPLHGSKILGREGRPDGVSSNENIRFCATAKPMGRFLRRTPNSQPPSKIPHVILAHGSQWIGLSDSQENEDNLVSLLCDSQPPCIIPHLFYTYHRHTFLCQLVSEMSYSRMEMRSS